MDKIVWDEFGETPDVLREYCKLIRLGVDITKASPEPEFVDDEPEFYEGRILTKYIRQESEIRAYEKN